jgi:uncharacterized membrane protein
LIAASFLFDVCATRAKQRRPELRAAAFYALILAAVGAIGAIVSGLALCHWSLASEGLLAWHHRCVWLASALVIGLAALRISWRAKRGPDAPWSARMTTGYLTVALLATGCMSAAGYFGGLMLMQ